MHRLQELVRLHRLGVGERRAAKELRMGRNTAREYRRAIASAGMLDGSAEDLPPLETLRAVVVVAMPPKPAPQQVSKMEEWQPQVESLLEKRLGPQAIYDRLRLEDHPRALRAPLDTHYLESNRARDGRTLRRSAARERRDGPALHDAHVLILDGASFRNPPPERRKTKKNSHQETSA